MSKPRALYYLGYHTMNHGDRSGVWRIAFARRADRFARALEYVVDRIAVRVVAFSRVESSAISRFSNGNISRNNTSVASKYSRKAQTVLLNGENSWWYFSARFIYACAKSITKSVKRDRFRRGASDASFECETAESEKRNGIRFGISIIFLRCIFLQSVFQTR